MARRIRRARKQHVCMDCGRTIKPGEQYEDGRSRKHLGQAFRRCMACADISHAERTLDSITVDYDDQAGNRTCYEPFEEPSPYLDRWE